MNEQQNKPAKQEEDSQLASGKPTESKTDPRQEDVANEQDTARIRTEKQSVEDGSKQQQS